MKLKLLILILALQSAWIVATAIVQETRLSTGRVVLLETAPVDPRDLLRGDYVILSYKISRVPMDLFAPPVAGPLPAGTPVYVTLEQRGQFYEIVSASTERPSSSSDRLVLKGRIRFVWQPDRGNPVLLDYG